MLVWLTAMVASPGWSLTLVNAGKSVGTIIGPPDNGSALSRVAPDVLDLQVHLQKMSGALVPIVTDPADARGVRLWVGVKPADLKLPGGVDLSDERAFWPDGYLLLSDGRENLYLLAPRPEGVANAIYGLLEDHLGCHWYTPGEIGECIPKRNTVTVSIKAGGEVVRPSFELRQPWYNGNAVPYKEKAEQAAIARWQHRNRAGGLRGYIGQDWLSIYPKALQEQEPGLQAMLNGKREARGAEAQVCLSYPRAVEIARDYFVRVFTANPELDYYTFSANDNNSWCQCPACQAMGANQTERLMVFANQVADAVAKACPGKGIGMITFYTGINDPPSPGMKVARNIYPVICSYGMEQVKPKTDDNAWCNAYRSRIEAWMKLMPRAFSYDYIGWYPGPWTLFHKLQQEQDYYRGIGFTGLCPEYLDRNLGTDVHMWLSLKLAWDKGQQVDDLLSQFYTDYFGPAAGDMRGVYEGFEREMTAAGSTGEYMDVPRLYPQKVVDDALATVAKAEQLVGQDPVRRARIGRDESCLKLTKLFLQAWAASGAFRRSGTPADREQAILASQAYLQGVGDVAGQLVVGQTARGFVQASLEALQAPGTTFSQGGPFRYDDDLNDGGKSYQALSKSGFSIGMYGLGLAPNATGEIIYEVKATGGLKFKSAHLAAMYLALPEGGHNQVDLSLDGGQTWKTVYQDVKWWGGGEEPDLTAAVGGCSEFRLRFVIHNGPQEILGMDNWAMAGVIE